MNGQVNDLFASLMKEDGYFLPMERPLIDQIRLTTKAGYRLERVGDSGLRCVKESLYERGRRFVNDLPTTLIGKHVYFFETVSSTQTIAKQFIPLKAKEGTLIIAEEQTAGRGRMARKWYSQKGGLWFSVIVKPNIPIKIAPQLTLLTAVAVVRAIKDVLPLQPKIKWPNDILINGKKVCGILTELQSANGSIEAIIIGVGMNVNQGKNNFPKDIRPIATSIFAESGNTIDLFSLLKAFCVHFEQLYEQYLQHGFKEIQTLWEQNCDTIGKEVVATTIRETIDGKVIGISEEGALLIKKENGKVSEIFSADLTNKST
ncbi:biotin--[acetyl-CoA-carboxylase] ligase [Fervidibacillus albus]|uniref:Bifunctional ligase/repressor BirA n=1 Tax=Fervidibacillus albus TaxID=2980026 RepID=A0A9E8RWY4_9BACI|nr:biotin--[acetyl-CoA-carboxylase] ligase [Fervidibacillus albus]WAA10578.1 biotin--[acetyl-CoA-carboxylase] ligase [Fervidibacillus albus]